MIANRVKQRAQAVLAHYLDGPPTMATVRRRVLEMNANEAAILTLVLMVVQTLSWSLWGGLTLLLPSWRQYVDTNIMLQMGMVYFISYVLIGLYIKGIWRQRHQNNSFQTSSLAQLFYATLMIYAAYCSGLYALTVGVVLMGICVVGLLFFTGRSVLRTIAYSFFLIASLTYCTLQEILPYAPLYRNEYVIGIDVGYTRFYTFSQLYIALPVLVVLVLSLSMVFYEWQARTQEITDLSRLDNLTGLLNRRAIFEQLQQLLALNASFSILLLDLDHFKSINDLHGHLVGDKALKQVALVLQQSLRQVDSLARIGGEEFMILLPNVDVQNARMIAERCRLALATTHILNDEGESIFLTGSFGVVTSDPAVSRLDIDQIYHLADQALYQAKQSGRNRIAVALSG